MSTEVSNHIMYLLATKAVDFANDTFKIRLMADGFTFDKDSHAEWSDCSASELANGNGYTTGGNTLSGVSVTEDDSNDRCSVAWSNSSWTASGGDIGPSPGAVVIDDTVTDDPVVGYVDFGGDQTAADGATGTIANIEFRLRQPSS